MKLLFSYVFILYCIVQTNNLMGMTSCEQYPHVSSYEYLFTLEELLQDSTDKACTPDNKNHNDDCLTDQQTLQDQLEYECLREAFPDIEHHKLQDDFTDKIMEYSAVHKHTSMPRLESLSSLTCSTHG